MSLPETKQVNGPANMALFKRLSKNKHTKRHIVKLIAVDFVFSVYVYYLLKLTDILLSRFIFAYQATESYLLSAAVFFFVSLAFFYFSIKYNWNRLFPYFAMALAVYFPLVTLSSYLRIYNGLPEEVTAIYFDNFCSDSNSITLCGEALAHMVFSLSIRALPTVLSVPYLYWLAIQYLKLDSPREHIDV